MRNRLLNFSATALLALSSCAPVMEATRPNPVDIHQFMIGEPRMSVIQVIGAPQSNLRNSAEQSCDVYRLYTRGPDAISRGAIAAGEAVADVFTLGLTEIIFTPVEVGTRQSQHTVTFCYDDGKLAAVNDGGPVS